MTYSQIPEQTKLVVDAVSVSTIIATLLSWLPHVAALVSIIWGIIRIWETDTVQKLRRKKD